MWLYRCTTIFHRAARRAVRHIVHHKAMAIGIVAMPLAIAVAPPVISPHCTQVCRWVWVSDAPPALTIPPSGSLLGGVVPFPAAYLPVPFPGGVVDTPPQLWPQPPTKVPEPMTVVLLLTAVFWLAMIRSART